MTDYIKTFYNKIQVSEKFFLILIVLFPLSIMLGNLIINISFLLIFVIFLIDIYISKDFYFIKDKIILLLIGFFFFFINKFKF